MKYLKEFKIFEGVDEIKEIKSYLSQIFLELEDEGYKVDIESIWLRTFNNEGFTYYYTPGFKIKISGKDTEEDVIPSIQTSISYMTSQDFGKYWIMVENFGKLTVGELKSYFNLKKSLVNSPNRTLELNFNKG